MKYSLLLSAILLCACSKYEKGEFIGSGAIPDPYTSGTGAQLLPKVNDDATSARGAVARGIPEVKKLGQINRAEGVAIEEIHDDLCQIYEWYEGEDCALISRENFRKEETGFEGGQKIALYTAGGLYKTYMIDRDFKYIEERKSNGEVNSITFSAQTCFNQACFDLR